MEVFLGGGVFWVVVRMGGGRGGGLVGLWGLWWGLMGFGWVGGACFVGFGFFWAGRFGVQGWSWGLI